MNRATKQFSAPGPFVGKTGSPLPPATLPVFDSYFALVADDPPDGFGWVRNIGEFQKNNGQWVPVLPSATLKQFQYATDYVGRGQMRAAVTPPNGQVVYLHASSVAGRIFAAAPSGPDLISYSANGGISWNVASIAAGQWRVVTTCVNNGWLYAFNVNLPLQRAAMSLDNGSTWTLEATPAASNITFRDACWDYGHDRVVAVGLGSATGNNSMFKQDTAAWDIGTHPNNNDLLSVCYDTKRSRLVAVGNVGGLDRCQISTNGGSTWTTRNMPSNSSWIKVFYSEIADRLFAFAFAGVDRGCYSDDGGDTWAVIPALNGLNIFSGCEIPHRCRIVIVEDNGGMMYSDDYGATWTATVGGSSINPSYFAEYDTVRKVLVVGGLNGPTITHTAGTNL